MVKHLQFLGVLYLIWGGLAGLLGVSAFALAGGAAMTVASAAPGDESARLTAGLTAATFAALGLVALVWGAVNAASGRALRRSRHWSRVALLALGVVNLLILPFGTALGIYTLWVLLAAESKSFLAGAPAAHHG